MTIVEPPVVVVSVRVVSDGAADPLVADGVTVVVDWTARLLPKFSAFWSAVWEIGVPARSQAA